MKIVIILIMASQIFAYDSWNRYLHNENLLKHKKLNMNYQKYLDQKNRMNTREINNRRMNESNKAMRANENFFREQQSKSQRYKYNQQASSTIEEYKPKDFKNKAQIKLGELHILGVKSIKPFKDGKFIIKAESGTFALPKDKLEEAEKINFSKEMMTWK